MKRPENQIFVIFGARGDLAMRKIIPALYSLFVQDLLPERYAVLATGRSKVTDDAYQGDVRAAVDAFSEEKNKSRIKDFADTFRYIDLDPSLNETFAHLTSSLANTRTLLGSRG